MSIYDINYTQQGAELMPPDKRDSNTLAVITSVLSALQWARDLIFTSYRTGSTAPVYSAGVYNKNDTVVFNKSVYLSLIAANTSDPTVASAWLKIQENFIGVNERVKFNTQRIVLEYALNKRFGGTFRSPGSSSLSDINLTNSPSTIVGFKIGQTEAFSSAVGQTTSSDNIGSRSTFIHVNNFQINILNALYLQTSNSTISNFTDLYISFSLKYTIQPY